MPGRVLRSNVPRGGIDFSKATLDVHRLSDGKAMSFSNCPAGFKSLANFCAKTAVARVVYEATGAYHSGLERALGAHLPLVKVNPLQARRLAQAQGVRAKTDAVDAKMLAEMGNVFALEPDEPAEKIQHDLPLENPDAVHHSPQSKARLAQVDKQISEINDEVDRLISSSKFFARSLASAQSALPPF